MSTGPKNLPASASTMAQADWEADSGLTLLWGTRKSITISATSPGAKGPSGSDENPKSSPPTWAIAEDAGHA
eukprot:CAMPEP_0115539324 /NCGR_PEP_ID=MMETSP0271-20121206/89349_1 /TAXON_ID=71861 /ORGANISM="Scrippsiella trochoidea, Strain CCMP3099" /LENGTH=71 /DNA_ID=CAMNT_0002972275 /DNA_START=214 /DNA_END=425 /DNA_ORIENTATION=+